MKVSLGIGYWVLGIGCMGTGGLVKVKYKSEIRILKSEIERLAQLT
jgi:hypothetical protein